jgi:hypothetical protein
MGALLAKTLRCNRNKNLRENIYYPKRVSLRPAAPHRNADLVLSKLGLTGIDSLRKLRVSVPGVDGSSPAKKSIKQQSATIRTPWLPSLELSTAIVPPG